MFINDRCTARCFYCPQDRGLEKKCTARVGGARGIEFHEPRDYAYFLDLVGYRGVGFSGGEPLLAAGKLISYIQEIKERLGRKCYVWVYTNGDLVNRDILRSLKRAGLDEIRFNVSARGYRLQKAALAVDFISTVSVEIPCIPADFTRLKKCLIPMQRAGVKHLHLHQLYPTRYNYKNFIRRGYTFLRYPPAPVLDSEMCALRLMRYAMDERIRLPIQYCSATYKTRLQSRGHRLRHASVLNKKKEEALTAAGFIRHIAHGDRGDIREVRYWSPGLAASPVTGEPCREIELPSGRTIFAFRNPMVRWSKPSLAAQQAYRGLVLERLPLPQALRHLFSNFTAHSKADGARLEQEIRLLKSIAALEFLEEGFPDIC